ncbi:apoptosis-antagonizing transcription factor [Lipomyces tetrasporus]|uniref:Protein BFR2 n=1 Tax=Lipomyces tetrasporus TaxID=54092 RepID=A0AAD7QSZ9_9ASCO|nr:apoptosis-antagonizing transcription factor [Lipomyces tetrasporus]KAJ8100895.1 apoptosis-antagonizing transcription factor [Lipomyces tetrasporus]
MALETSDENYLNGLAVKRQIAIYERTLDGRIQLQKALTALNLALSLSRQDSYGDNQDVQVLVHEAEEKVLHLMEQLISLRTKLLEVNSLLAPGAPSRKRKRSATVQAHYDACTAFNSTYTPYRTAVLGKWSRKVQSANSMSGLGNKFTVLNQSISSQLEDLLRDTDRLVARTRVNRTTSAGNVKLDGATHEGRVDDGAVYNSGASLLYDDTDFYQILLKDLVDKNMAATDAGGVTWTVSKPKTKRPNLDVKASKGRKLRYHVQEKIQNFMPPIPSTTWNDEQIDDLFSGLFGQKVMDVVQEEQEV